MLSNSDSDKERKIKKLNKMKDLMSKLAFWEGDKHQDLQSIDREIDKIQKSSLK